MVAQSTIDLLLRELSVGVDRASILVRYVLGVDLGQGYPGIKYFYIILNVEKRIVHLFLFENAFGQAFIHLITLLHH